ncbi:MAG: S-adenosylmethionine:tRNA ribosyltransferase-isomerase, partial [Myxococcota bacterium]
SWRFDRIGGLPAALPLAWSTILALRGSGVGVAAVTHAAGVSSIDGGAVDATLPWPERSAIPQATVDAIGATRGRGGRVIAVGTTVVRALEGRIAAAGRLVAGEGVATVVFDGSERPAVVDGVVTKLHAPDESHFRVLTPFAPAGLLIAAFRAAAARGLRNHEFGDSVLIVGSPDGTVAG